MALQQRKLSTPSEFEWVNGKAASGGATSSEEEVGERGGEEAKADSVGGEGDEERFDVLMEGGLNMSVRMEEAEGEEGGSATLARTLRTLRSNGSFSKTWKKRWCVFSRTVDGLNIFYYNKKSSYTNCDMPVGVLFLEECLKIYTLPNHPKSRLVFAIEFPYRTVQFYPEKEHDLGRWLALFCTTLTLTEETYRPLSVATLKSSIRQKSRRLAVPSSSSRVDERSKVYIRRTPVVATTTGSGVAKQPVTLETADFSLGTFS